MRMHRLILTLLLVLSPLYTAHAWDSPGSTWGDVPSATSTTSSYAASATLPSLFQHQEEQHELSSTTYTPHAAAFSPQIPTYTGGYPAPTVSTDQQLHMSSTTSEGQHIVVDKASLQFIFETTINGIKLEHKKDWVKILNGSDDISVAFQNNFTAFRISLLNPETQNIYIKEYIQNQFTQIFEHYESGRSIATRASIAVGCHKSRSKKMMDALITLSSTLGLSLPMEIYVKYDWVNYKASGQVAADYFAETKRKYKKQTKLYIEQFFIYLGQRNTQDRSTIDRLACFMGAKTSATEQCAIYLISLCRSSRSTYKFPAEFLKKHLSFLYEDQYEAIMES